MPLFRSSAAFLTVGLASLATAANFEVTVGKDNKLEFNPPSLKAQIGDTVTYKFFSKNHAVAQSTFADPCHIQENGIFSGFTANPSSDTAAPTDFTITINDTKPLWFYCPQTNGNHCQNGMVHAINAPDTGNTFDAYKAKAQQAAIPSTPPVGTLPVGGLRKLHIDVGFNGQLMFNPNNVTELVGTVVQFSYNPSNHSIVQSSFDKPCQPIDRPGGGFAAPFVPTKQAPSGVTFEVTLTNPDPIWFYCAQTTKSHCQSGMVGSINAATEGAKTFQAFKDLAAKAGPSTITPDTPLVGALKVNGTFIVDVGGDVLDTTVLDPSLGSNIPAAGTSYPPFIGSMAGGEQPANYNWGTNVTDQATAVLQSLQYIDNLVVALLLEGYNLLTQGQWAGVYPDSITQTLGSLVAQSLIHRRTYTDSLQHFGKDVVAVCAKYDLAGALADVDAWLGAVQTALQLSVGATLDAVSALAVSDPWTTPALASAMGSQTRMAALLNLMQNHVVATAPREALIPSLIATSYIASTWAKDPSCAPPSAPGGKAAASALPALTIKSQTKQVDSGRVTQITVDVPQNAASSSGSLFIAWLGPWGNLQFTSVDAKNSTAAVPASLSGHVWAVLTNKADVQTADIAGVAVAGPAVLWVSQQWSVNDL
ncbi:hypothetical protein F5Y17DRAFT_455812 [Xylariaceae sp. FL0594]|nr:hypothetical protein F5Y17DRAFT_455812 [Xylariaceae sp. FL0594]